MLQVYPLMTADSPELSQELLTDPNGAKLSRIRDGFLPRSRRGQEGSTRGFNHIRVKIIARRFDGRMVFVPEGQHDRSQARSAWNHEENSHVPAGRLNRSHRTQTFHRSTWRF